MENTGSTGASFIAAVANNSIGKNAVGLYTAGTCEQLRLRNNTFTDNDWSIQLNVNDAGHTMNQNTTTLGSGKFFYDHFTTCSGSLNHTIATGTAYTPSNKFDCDVISTASFDATTCAGYVTTPGFIISGGAGIHQTTLTVTPPSGETCNPVITSCSACKQNFNIDESDIEAKNNMLSQILAPTENLSEDLPYLTKLNTAILFMKQYNDADASKFLIAAYYETGQYDKMNSTMNSLSNNDKDMVDYKDLFSLLAIVSQNGRNLNQLTDKEYSSIKTLAGRYDNQANAIAQNILFHYYDEYYPTKTILAKTIERTEKTDINQSNDVLSIYPNPSENNTTISYKLFDNNNNCIIITDIYGKVISLFKLNDEEGKIEYNTRNLSAGLYICTIKQNNIVINSTKFVKQ